MSRNSGTSNDDGQGREVFNSNNVTFTTFTMKNNFSSNMWIPDSGANCYNYQSVEGLTEFKDINESSKIGNDDSMKATIIGNLKYEVNQINGEKFMIILNDVKHVPNLCVNYFAWIKY
jgi:hypothetical protein